MTNIIDFLNHENIKDKVGLYREKLHKGAEDAADFLAERLKRQYELGLPIISYDPKNTWFYYETLAHRNSMPCPEMDYSTTLPYFKEYLLSLIKTKCGFITNHIQFEDDPFHITITDELVILSFTINHEDYLKLDVSKVSKPLQETITKLRTYHEQTQKEEPYVHDKALWQSEIEDLILEITKSLEDISDWDLEILRCEEGKEVLALHNTFEYDKSFFIKKQSFGDVLYQSRPIPPLDNTNKSAYHALKGDMSYNIKDFDPEDIDPDSFTKKSHRFNMYLERQIRDALEKSDNPLIKEMMKHLWHLDFNKEGIDISLKKHYDKWQAR